MPNEAGWIYNYQSLIGERASKTKACRVTRGRTDNIGQCNRVCDDALKDLHRQCKDNRLPRLNVEVPPLPAVPTEAVWLLSDFIETADAGEADLIVELLNDLQLQSAKVRGMIANIDKKHWMRQHRGIFDRHGHNLCEGVRRV